MENFTEALVGTLNCKTWFQENRCFGECSTNHWLLNLVLEVYCSTLTSKELTHFKKNKFVYSAQKPYFSNYFTLTFKGKHFKISYHFVVFAPKCLPSK